MSKKQEIPINVKCVFIIIAFITIAFIMMGIFAAIGLTDKLIYIAIPTSIIGGGSLIFLFLNEFIKSYKEYKSSILLADLEEFKLPKFKINEETQRLYQIYNFNIVNKSLHSRLRYSLLSSKIHIVPKKGWTTILYYVNDVVFVNCKNSKNSWWGICRRFEEHQFIWGLYHKFELFYEDSLKCCNTIKILDDTKLKGAEQSQWNPELGNY